ncbi:MAG: peptidoglycan recognition family protein [Nanoarchaeota archaeon]
MNIIRKYNPYGSAHQKPERIIVHAMGEYVFTGNGNEFLHAPDFLLKESLSAHALVAPDGTVYRCRDDDQGAYHARGFNSGSLGIEIMVQGRYDVLLLKREIETQYIKDAQYHALVEQCKEWIKLYGIADIKRHSDVSPGRKTDPGNGFPWSQLLKDLGFNKKG